MSVENTTCPSIQILKPRKNMYIVIDDIVLTIMENQAAQPPREDLLRLYTVIHEDAHGETSVNVLTYEEILKQLPAFLIPEFEKQIEEIL